MSNQFILESSFSPSGDQPEAIKSLVHGIQNGEKDQTLLGVTGSGKTFTMASVIHKIQRPTLVISHNKTLAAQLAGEFREFFPKNAVHYFVSYYDYYQPEAYIARSDTYIEKETQVNEEIDRLRHASTQSLLSRKDVIIVASVSCIYGLGSPAEYKAQSITVNTKGSHTRKELIIQLVEMQFQRNEIDFSRGTFRVRGDIIEVYPTSSEHTAFRFDFFGDDIETIQEVDVLTGEILLTYESIDIYPARLYQAQTEHFETALQEIREDMKKEVALLEKAGKQLEAHRLKQRVSYDLEMIENVGYTNGIENYSRYFDGRKMGEAPYTLIDYFPKDFLLCIDESHQTIPQIGAMYSGDRARKQSLIEYGFRLQSALDNRPLTFEEFEKKKGTTIYISATPGAYEKEYSTNTAQQLIRPTGIIEPPIDIHSVKNQIPHLLSEVEQRVQKKQRVLITTLTKRMAEDLAEFMNEKGIAVQYLHSDVDTMERLEILRDLRLGVYDVLIGINLLREGLDLPEVSLVAILDADKEGFLRSETSLIQTMGRAARHMDGRVILYADRITGSMERAIAEVDRRREAQHAYNQKHGITPQSTKRAIRDERIAGKKEDAPPPLFAIDVIKKMHREERNDLLQQLHNQMNLAAESLDFEKAAQLRDQIARIEEMQEGKKIQPKKRR